MRGYCCSSKEREEEEEEREEEKREKKRERRQDKTRQDTTREKITRTKTTLAYSPLYSLHTSQKPQKVMRRLFLFPAAAARRSGVLHSAVVSRRLSSDVSCVSFCCF